MFLIAFKVRISYEALHVPLCLRGKERAAQGAIAYNAMIMRWILRIERTRILSVF